MEQKFVAEGWEFARGSGETVINSILETITDALEKGQTITKREFAALVADQTGFTNEVSEIVIDVVLGTIAYVLETTVKKGQPITKQEFVALVANGLKIRERERSVYVVAHISAIYAVIHALIDVLEKGKGFSLKDFGAFETSRRYELASALLQGKDLEASATGWEVRGNDLLRYGQSFVTIYRKEGIITVRLNNERSTNVLYHINAILMAAGLNPIRLEDGGVVHDGKWHSLDESFPLSLRNDETIISRTARKALHSAMDFTSYIKHNDPKAKLALVSSILDKEYWAVNADRTITFKDRELTVDGKTYRLTEAEQEELVFLLADTEKLCDIARRIAMVRNRTSEQSRQIAAYRVTDGWTVVWEDRMPEQAPVIHQTVIYSDNTDGLWEKYKEVHVRGNGTLVEMQQEHCDQYLFLSALNDFVASRDRQLEAV
ncbi:hypothetical protein FACS1894103_4690 [Campylobacterota bacterium]|nr:hypothetical protein FACS1894103_4690 [Campylobacterota bacterium]